MAEAEKTFHSAVRWSAVSKYACTIVRIAQSLITARILAPELFGIVEMAFVFLEFVRAVGYFGLSEALVREKELEEDFTSSVFWLNAFVCTCMFLLMLMFAPIASLVYDDVVVGQVTAVLSIYVFLHSSTIVQESLLRRRLRYDKLAIAEIGAVLCSGFIAVTLALAGFGVWSIALASVAGGSFRAASLMILSPYRPRAVFRRSLIRKTVKFGSRITGATLVNYVGRNLDKLIIGVGLGPAALGLYALAQRLVCLPLESVQAVVERVLLPRFSRDQEDDEKLGNLYLRVVNGIALITLPMLLVAALIPYELIGFVLGEKWMGAAPLVSILAPFAAVTAICQSRGRLLITKGKTGELFGITFVSTAIRVFAIFVGVTSGGLIGLCIGALVAKLIDWFVGDFLAFKSVEGLSIKKELACLLPILFAGTLAAIVGGVVAYVTRSFDSHDFVVICCSSIATLTTYFVVVCRLGTIGLQDVLLLIPLRFRRNLPGLQ